MLVHGIVIGSAAWLSLHFRTKAIVDIGVTRTLELIAAPASAPEPSAKAVVVAPPAPAPSPPPITEEIPRAIIVTPTPIVEPAEPILPAPTPDVVTETVLPPSPIIPPITPAPSSAARVGDNSSPTPGNNATTVTGKPLTLARPDHRKNPEPEYPLAARRRGQQGAVLLNVTVSTTGRATEITVKQSSGFDLLDQAAARAVQTWEFEPARVGGIAVESKIEQAVRFKLTN